jgi:hypothetical protein
VNERKRVCIIPFQFFNEFADFHETGYERYVITYAHPDFSLGGRGGADPEDIYNLCLTLKNYVLKVMS